MDLFIANCSTQEHVFVYRLQERQQAPIRSIKAGQQIRLENLDQADVDKIVSQHARYGMKPVEEFSRRKGVTALCYSTKGWMDVDRMLETFDANDDTKNVEAQKRREVTAAAISQSIGKEIGKVSGGNASPPSRLEVEVIEDTNDSSGMAAGVEVVADMDRTRSRRIGKGF